jgi:glycyl-tRNA synthetase
MANNESGVMEKLVSLCKRKGFVYQGSEIYGGLAGTWDFGPLGVALKNNLKALWWSRFVLNRDDMYGMDAAILMNPAAWEASGHVAGFADPLVECNKCQRRHRVDQLVNEADFKAAVSHTKSLTHDQRAAGRPEELLEEFLAKKGVTLTAEQKKVYAFDAAHDADAEVKKMEEYVGGFTRMYLMATKVKCPACGATDWGVPRRFNMMLKTHLGATEDDASVSYLRPETAGGMFVNFKNVVDSFHPKLPFGLAQIGKAFRNEIAPRDFIFRLRELEQMEIEYFVKPAEWAEAFESFRREVWAYTKDIGLSQEKVHELEVADEDRAHYSKRTIDFEFDYPFGRKELYGLAYRTDFDLTAHQNRSKQDLSYFDEETKERLTPHVIEPSFGVDRTVLAVLADAYREDELGGEPRVYLALSPKVAPFLACVSPLLKNKPQLVEKAREVRAALAKAFPGRVAYDDNGNIGKRYRRQDEIGTPYCVTVDFDTMEGKDAPLDTVTLRHRDSGEQERIAFADLASRLAA